MGFIDMTIKRARQILGSKINDLSDEEVNQLINNMSVITDDIFRIFLHQLTETKQLNDTKNKQV